MLFPALRFENAELTTFVKKKLEKAPDKPVTHFRHDQLCDTMAKAIVKGAQVDLKIDGVECEDKAFCKNSLSDELKSPKIPYTHGNDSHFLESVRSDRESTI